MGRRLWTDPLLHFVALGGVVFAVQLALEDAPAAPGEAAGGGTPVATAAAAGAEERASTAPRIIEVPAGLAADVRRTLQAKLDRIPTEAEVRAGVEAWIDTEILAREAQSMGLGQADPQIRARLAEKMAFVLEAKQVGEGPSEAALRERYDAAPERWRLPTLHTVRQLYVEGTDEAARARAEAVAAQAAGLVGADADHAGLQALYTQTDPPPGGPLLRGRTTDRLRQTHGPALADAVRALALDTWKPVLGGAGWHIVRVEERRVGRTLSFADARGRLEARWRAERSRQAAERALATLRDKYEVRRPETP
jgi:hypothetical protein